MTALGLDCGGTASRWHLLDAAGKSVGHGTGAPLSGHLFTPDARDAAMAALRDLARDIRAVESPVAALVAGVTGLSADGPEGRVLADTLAAFLTVPVDRINVRNDLWLAYHAAFAPGAGILVYAGTGSAACHVDTDGGVWNAGGHGCLIDDAGSGFWIGQRALRWLMRRADATGAFPSGPLVDALFARIGGSDWEAVRAYAYTDSRHNIAALAPAIAEAAEAGDPTATGIIAAAGRALAEPALALVDRVGLRPVALAGGVARLHPLLFETFDRSLAVPDCQVVDIDPAATGARLALDMLGGATPDSGAGTGSGGSAAPDLRGQ